MSDDRPAPKIQPELFLVILKLVRIAVELNAAVAIIGQKEPDIQDHMLRAAEAINEAVDLLEKLR